MSVPKPSLAAQWRVAERAIEEEADRLAHLSDEEFARAMEDLPPPSRMPSTEEMMAEVTARIRARGGARERKDADGALAADGRAGDAWSVEAGAIGRSPTPPRLVWLVAAAFFVAVGGLAFVKREAIVAYLFHDEPNHHDDKSAPRHEELSPQARAAAAAAREQARTACAGDQIDLCETRLDEARGLDPAGDDKPDVALLRQKISDARSGSNGADDKPNRPKK
jgi:hypothetical protein